MDTEPPDFLSSLPIWRTVTLGQFSSAEGYLVSSPQPIFTAGYRESLDLIPISTVRREIELVRFKWQGIRFNHKNITHADIAAHVARSDLRACPAEAALALRVEYLAQPPMEWLCMVTELPGSECSAADICNDGNDFILVFEPNACIEGMALEDNDGWDRYQVYMRERAAT